MSILASMNFNANDVEPAAGFEPLPDGAYTVMVEKAEEKETKRKDGVQLVITHRVIEGKYAKRTLFQRINLANPSPQCVQIGRAEFSAFCRATGILTPKHCHEFANRTLIAHVKVAQRSDGKGLTNEISKLEPVASAVQGLVSDGSSKASQPVAASVGPAPWAGK